MKSGKVLTMKAVALGVAVMFIAASCGSSGSSSSGKTKNSALCFATQEDKDAAIATAQADLDAANASDTTGATGGYRRPAVRSMSGDTTVPPDSTVVATDETTDTSVPSSDSTVVDSGPNIPMLEQALADAQNQPLCDAVPSSNVQGGNTQCAISLSYNGEAVVVDACAEATRIVFGDGSNGGVFPIALVAPIDSTVQYTIYVGDQVVAQGTYTGSEGSVSVTGNYQVEGAVDTSSDNNAAPYFNAPTDLTATADADGNVSLSWTAPAASNVEPVMYWIGWGAVINGEHTEKYVVWTRAANTTYSLGSWLWGYTDASTVRFHVHAGTGPCIGEGSGECLYGPDALADLSFPASADTTPPQDTVPADNTPPYFNKITNLTATANADGSVVLNWTAPEASNVEPAMISIDFYDIDSGQETGGWGIWTRPGNTSYVLGHWMFDGNNPVTTGYGAVRFRLFAGNGACIGEGPGACLYGPSTSVDVNVLDPNSGTTVTTDGPTDTTVTTDAPTDTTVATVTTDATATTVKTIPQIVFIETSLSVVELLTETPVLVPTDVASMVCDEDCISAMFTAAGLDSGTVTINGVSASFGSKSLQFPVDGKTGTIKAVVASGDGKSVLDLSTNFDHVERKYSATAPASAAAATSTSGSSKSIYIYVLIALLILVAIGYMRRKKATETK